MMVRVVDLFCGIGGMTHGFILEGFDVAAGVDLDATCRHAYEANNAAPFIERDVGQVTAAELAGYFGNATTRILVGCAPCQPFSHYTKGNSPGEKWRLLDTFGRLVAEARPDVVSMENVPALTRHEVFPRFVRQLETLGYWVSHRIAKCHRFGVPQRRSRLVLLASRLGPIALPLDTHTDRQALTVRDAIGALPPIPAGGAVPGDPVHRARNLSPRNLERIRHTPPGGWWRDWPDELRLACHGKANGKTFRTVYGRMAWDEPAPTITTQCVGLGNGQFGHPEQDRAISVREAALLQSFPAAYDLLDPAAPRGFSAAAIARHVGNAVPVRLARAVASAIAFHLKQHGVEFAPTARGRAAH